MNKETIDRIKAFYNPQHNQLSSFSITVNGKVRHMSLNDNKPVFLGFGQAVSNEQEAIEKGFLKTNGRDLFTSIFPEEWEELKYKYEDVRTENYLKVIRESIGLVEIKNGWDEEKLTDVSQYFVYANASPVEIGTNGSGQWVAQYSVRTNIDDYNVTRMFFASKPSLKDVETVRTIENVEFYFFKNGYDRSTFKCWECGSNNHWLDGSGSLSEKFENLKEKYCGC